MTLPSQIKAKVEKILQSKLEDSRPLTGGCSYPSFHIQTSEGDAFLKFSDKSSEVFEKEANGLKALASAGAHTPKIIAVDSDFLLLEYLEAEEPTDEFWKNLAKNLAETHLHQEEGFGFFENNYIGKSPQVNLISNAAIEWADFFWQYRILMQLNWLKESRGYGLPDPVVGILETCIKKELSQHSVFPSPLHGDLWNGNVHCGPQQKAYLIDPATYFGDRETDIAMTELFGGFPTLFYETYSQHFPLDHGYKTRKEVYKLYHLLNHFLIFGNTYQNTVEDTINNIVKN